MADGPLDIEALAEVCMRRQAAVGRQVAYSFTPAIVNKGWGHKVSFAGRFEEASEWAYLMLQAELVPDEFVKVFDHIAQFTERRYETIANARRSIASGGSADSLPNRAKVARQAIAAAEEARLKAISLLNSHGIEVPDLPMPGELA